jgi:hypothetical protein
MSTYLVSLEDVGGDVGVLLASYTIDVILTIIESSGNDPRDLTDRLGALLRVPGSALLVDRSSVMLNVPAGGGRHSHECRQVRHPSRCCHVIS